MHSNYGENASLNVYLEYFCCGCRYGKLNKNTSHIKLYIFMQTLIAEMVLTSSSIMVHNKFHKNFRNLNGIFYKIIIMDKARPF